VSIQQHQQVEKRVIECILHINPSTLQSELHQHTSQSNCAIHTTILFHGPTKVHISVTHSNVNKIQQHQHIATELCHPNIINKSRHASRVHSTQQPIHTTIGTATTLPFKLRHSHSYLLPSTNKGPYTCHEYRRQDPTTITSATESCHPKNINKSRNASSTAFHTATHTHHNRNCKNIHLHWPAPLTQTSHSVDQQRFIYLSRITSTRTNNNKTLQRSRVHIPVTHINVDKHKQQHTATQSCHSNNNNKSQRRHVNEGILHSAHTHHNRNRNNIFKLRNSHSSLFPPIIKGNTYPSRYVDKIQQQQHAVTQPWYLNNTNKLHRSRVIAHTLQRAIHTSQSELQQQINTN
jgi:hypothetical protein